MLCKLFIRRYTCIYKVDAFNLILDDKSSDYGSAEDREMWEEDQQRADRDWYVSKFFFMFLYQRADRDWIGSKAGS